MLISICSKEQCTGCAACLNICPKKCISMVFDAEGFMRPTIDIQFCDDCGACKRVCPILHLPEPNHSPAPQVYACWNKDEEVRFQSASGGAFSAFAQHILDSSGVVFGAAFDEKMRLKHIAVDRKEELRKLRSSKYVQSDVGRSYEEVKKLLRQERRVLFSGTPCQVAALYNFLHRDNENLLTCDIICHGVPSPGLFEKYVVSLERRFRAKVLSINFRHKRSGWNLMTTLAFFSDGRERILTGYNDSFMYAFNNYYSLRPACYRCIHTSVNRHGNITLADFWGIGELQPFYHSTRNGVSLIFVNSEKGRRLLRETSNYLCSEERTLEEAKHEQPHMRQPGREPKNRERFFADYKRLEYAELAKIHLVDKGLKWLVKRIVPRTWVAYLRTQIKKIAK